MMRSTSILKEHGVGPESDNVDRNVRYFSLFDMLDILFALSAIFISVYFGEAQSGRSYILT